MSQTASGQTFHSQERKPRRIRPTANHLARVLSSADTLKAQEVKLGEDDLARELRLVDVRLAVATGLEVEWEGEDLGVVVGVVRRSVFRVTLLARITPFS